MPKNGGLNRYMFGIADTISAVQQASLGSPAEYGVFFAGLMFGVKAVVDVLVKTKPLWGKKEEALSDPESFARHCDRQHERIYRDLRRELDSGEARFRLLDEKLERMDDKFTSFFTQLIHNRTS